MVPYQRHLRLARVTPGDDHLVRYARHIVLKEIGGDGQRLLGAARVTVVGAGGIGSPALQYLAAAGVGAVTIVDDDHVELGNLQRQTVFATDDVGVAKVTAAAATLARLNPAVDVHAVRRRIDAASARGLIAGADVVLDGCDNFATRLAVADAALALRIPLVSAAVGQFDGQLGVFRGWERHKPCYRCFVGDAPGRPGASCADDGILGPVAGLLGVLAALETIRAIVPFGEDSAGKIVLIDALALRFRTLALANDPGCTACGPIKRIESLVATH